MLDWNGNGKIDPIDIGVSIATEKEIEKTKVKDKKSNAGCLTSIVSVIGMIAIVILFII